MFWFICPWRAEASEAQEPCDAHQSGVCGRAPVGRVPGGFDPPSDAWMQAPAEREAAPPFLAQVDAEDSKLTL